MTIIMITVTLTTMTIMVTTIITITITTTDTIITMITIMTIAMAIPSITEPAWRVCMFPVCRRNGSYPIERDILTKNNAYADENRARFQPVGACLALNFMSSPGSGKTTLLVKTIEALKNRFPSW